MTTPTSLRGYVTDDLYYGALQDVLEHVPDVTYPLSVPTYAKMRREPALAAVLAAYTLPLRRATWAVDPTGCRDEVVQLVADDLGLPIIGVDKPGPARTRGVSWAAHIRAALGHLTFGHAAFEMLAEMRDGQARLVGLFERMQSTIQEIHIDQQGRLLGISQEFAPNRTRPRIPADRLVWYAHDPEGAALHGNSLLRPSFGYWLIKQELLRVAATSHRRFGMGVPTVEWATGANPTPAQMAEAQRAASAARVGDQSGLALPPGATLILKGLTGSAPDSIALLRYTDQQMSRSCLASFLDLGTSDTGSRALSESFIDLFTLSLAAVGQELADTVTRQIAARIVGWNFGDTEPIPAVTVSDVGTKHEITADAIQQLTQAGVLTPDPALEAYVRRSYRLPQREQNSPPPQPTPPASTPPAAAANRKPSLPAQPAVTTKPRAAARRKRQSSGQLALPIKAAAGDEDPVAASGVDLAAHQAAWESARDALLAQWPDLAQPLVDDLVAQVEDHINAGDIAALGALVIPAAVTAAISAALLAAMVDLAASGAAAVAAEAAHQGVTIDAGVVDADRLAQFADTAADVVSSGYATGAAREAMLHAGPDADGATVAAAVREHLDALTEAAGRGWVATNLAGALSMAQSYGRLATFEALQDAGHGLTMIASEVNDPGQCVNCHEIDGHKFDSLADAIAAYPTGRYRACLGADRCRGLLLVLIGK